MQSSVREKIIKIIIIFEDISIVCHTGIIIWAESLKDEEDTEKEERRVF